MSTPRPLRKIAIVVFTLALSLSGISMVVAAGSPPNSNIHDASFPTANASSAGWAVGDDGQGNAQILTQVSGNWQVVQTFNGKILNSITMISASEGYAVGNGGFIVEYHGNNWQAVTSPTTQNLHRVKQGSTGFGNVIFAVGDNETALFRAGDGGHGLGPGPAKHGGGGGSNWVLITNTPGGPALYGGAVVNDGQGGFIGYAVGAQGSIFEYDSTRFSWTTVNSGLTDDLSDVNLSDPNNGFATTFDGKVVTYANPTWALTTTLAMTNNGVLDLRYHIARPAHNSGIMNGGRYDLTGVTAIVVGNIGGTGVIGLDRSGSWGISNPVPQGITLNYLTVDPNGNIYAVGSGGTIIPIQ